MWRIYNKLYIAANVNIHYLWIIFGNMIHVKTPWDIIYGTYKNATLEFTKLDHSVFYHIRDIDMIYLVRTMLDRHKHISRHSLIMLSGCVILENEIMLIAEELRQRNN